MYIIIAILIFGILIAVHELGHFTAAKMCKVQVNEFSIGMGPAILKKQGKETLYSLRLLPIGGYCAMEGEEGGSDSPRAFSNQNRLKRFFILFAGAFMNLILGAVIIVMIYSSWEAFGTNTILSLADGFPDNGYEGLMPGDEVYSINGMRIYYSNDFSTAMSLYGDRVDIVVIRDGEKVKLDNYELVMREYTEDGETTVRYGINFSVIRANTWERLKYSGYSVYNFVRLIWYSLSELIAGNFGVKDLSGPVGIVSAMNEVGHAAETVQAGMINILYLGALIAVNLAVMNLLPIPGLDGGQIFLLVVTWVSEKVFRKKINPKYIGYVNTAGLVILMGFMVFIMISDVVKLIHG